MTLTANPSTASDLTLDLLGPAFGAEVVGLDLRKASDAQIASIGAALVDRKVLFFRGQDLTDDDQVELARRLGSPTAAHPVVAGLDDAHPEIYNIDSADGLLLLRRVAHRRDVHRASTGRLDPPRRPAATHRR